MSYAAFLCVRIETGTETSCLISWSLFKWNANSEHYIYSENY